MIFFRIDKDLGLMLETDAKRMARLAASFVADGVSASETIVVLSSTTPRSARLAPS